MNSETLNDHGGKFFEIKALFAAVEGLVSRAVNVASKGPRSNS